MGRNRSFRTKSSPPAPRKENLPATQNNVPGLGGSILGNIVTGMTFGAGSSLGHRAVDGVMGNRQETNETPQTVNTSTMPCEKLFEMYENCLKNEKNDCSYLGDMMRLKCSM